MVKDISGLLVGGECPVGSAKNLPSAHLIVAKQALGDEPLSLDMFPVLTHHLQPKHRSSQCWKVCP